MNGAAIFEFNFRSVNISRISYRPQFLIFALLSAIWLLFVPIGSSYGNELPGKIVGITDGDTVVLLTEEMKQVKVRLSGIDSPEKGQPFAQGAKNKLSQLVFGKFVRVTGSKFDRYGRFLGKITRMDLDVNLEMINSGFAWHYKKYAREQSLFDRKRYSDAELLARRQMIGLWSEVNPVPPWDFRGVRRK